MMNLATRARASRQKAEACFFRALWRGLSPEGGNQIWGESSHLSDPRKPLTDMPKGLDFSRLQMWSHWQLRRASVVSLMITPLFSTPALPSLRFVHVPFYHKLVVLFFALFICLFIFVHVCGGRVHVLWHMCGGQKTIYGSQFSPSTEILNSGVQVRWWEPLFTDPHQQSKLYV